MSDTIKSGGLSSAMKSPISIRSARAAGTRSHIHQILTNPIYAGRIRHKNTVHESQHDPTINPDRWDAMQQRLQGMAYRIRLKKTPRRVSLLCGKIFDGTGDRLTPSHSKTKKATRLRYYVSLWLIARSGESTLMDGA